jgi:hypothetical protein
MSTGYYTEKQQANEQVVVTAPVIPCASVLRLPRSVGKELKWYFTITAMSVILLNPAKTGMVCRWQSILNAIPRKP